MNRAQRLDAWLAGHAGLMGLAMTAWFALAAWRLYVPASLLTSNGHLIDPSTTDPTGYNVWSYEHLAYSDIYRLYAERGLFGHPLPYIRVPIEYPVVTGIYMWLASFAPGADGDFIASAVGLWIAGLVTLAMLRRLASRRYHWFALTPILLVFSLLNWDLLGICFLVVGLVMVRHERWARAGLALALGTCAKLFPVVVVPFLVARIVGDEGWRSKKLARLLGAFLVTCLVLNLPFALANLRNWSRFLSFNAGRPGAGLFAWLSGAGPEDAAIALVVLVATGIGVRSVLGGGSCERAAALTFGVFLLANKVYSPQYTLWMLVLALLAEWPLWTLGLLSLVGLGDYVGQFADLYATNPAVVGSATGAAGSISRAAGGTLGRWWSGTLAPWEWRLRDLGLAAAGVGAWLSREPGRSTTSQPAGSEHERAARAGEASARAGRRAVAPGRRRPRDSSGCGVPAEHRRRSSATVGDVPSDETGLWRRPGPRRSLPAATVTGAVGSLLIVIGASQGSSPFTFKHSGAWFFGISSALTRRFTGPRPQGTLSFVALLAVLIGVTLLALGWIWLVRARGSGASLSWRQVALIAMLWTLPLLVVAPLFSRDVYTYVAQGQMMAEHLDPYRYGPAKLGRRSPFERLTDPIWRRSVSPYGPIFLVFDQGVVLLTGHSLLWSIECLRLACLGGLWSAALGAASIARRLGRDPMLALVLVGLNPLLLLHLVAGVHDDAMMLGLLLPGVAAAIGGRPSLGVLLCALGAAVKVPALLGCVFIGWSCYVPAGSAWIRRAAGAAIAAAEGAALLVVLGLSDGLGLGWIKGLSNAGVVRLWVSPPTGIGMALGRLAQYAGLIHGRARWLEVITVTRGAGELAAGLIVAFLLARSARNSFVRALGWGLVAVAMLGSALWPWYLAWGVAVLAATAVGGERALVVAGSVAASYLALPVGSVVVGLVESASAAELAAAAAVSAAGALAIVLVALQIVRTPPSLGSGGWLDHLPARSRLHEVAGT